MNDGLGIAFGAKLMPGAFKPPSQFSIVVDFSVEDDLYRTIFVRKGLMPSFKIDNRQSTKAELDTGMNASGNVLSPRQV